MMRRLIAAAAAVVLLTGCDDSPAQPDPTSSSSSAPDDVSDGATPIGQDRAVECPADVVERDPALPDEVPEGATSVRLCDGGADRVTPPVDALTNEVASVVSAVNSQRVVSRGCADLQLPTYQLAFGYPDGSRFVVSGRFTGCAELLVGSARRAKAGPPLRTFVERLIEQRATSAPPDDAVDPASLDCAQQPEEWTWPLGDPVGLETAVLCVGQPERPERARRVVIPADDLELLVASIRRDTGPTGTVFGCGAFNPVEPWIVGADAWGDPIVLTKECLGFTVTEETEWRPRGQARDIVRRLVQKAH